MTPMLERAARGLAANYWKRMNMNDSAFASLKYPGGIEDYVAERWPLYVDDARAVLLAVREPDEAMDTAWDWDHVGPDRPAQVYWQAGIDAILQQEPK